MDKKVKILITGASGFVGTHLVEIALQQQFEVYAMVRKSSSIKYLKNATIVYGDINNEESLFSVFSNFYKNKVTIDYVIHTAALTKSNSKKDFFATNYHGTENLINALKLSNITPKKIIFISSLAASGPVKANDQIKVSHQNPITVYGQSKLQAEHLIKNSGLAYIIIRPTAVYGPGEKDLYTVFKFINKNINPVLGNHKQELTFIYVRDLVRLILRATISDVENEIYFASDGKIYDKHAFSIAISNALNKKPVNIKFPLAIVRIVAFFSQYISAITGKTSPLNLEKYNELVAESWNCEMTKTTHHFQFQAKHDLESGVKKTVEWYKQNKWI
ncbi:MAG: NAD(P)-dependent oxidoreductase [Bacteroidia bacterium]|nr:NAD(P)-dependent oxidoreductase [Bacteroidia bacterium]